MTDLVLGIDPGQSSGWAVATVAPRPVLEQRGRARLDRGEVPTRVLERLRAELVGPLVAIAIETQFVKKNVRSAISLAQTAGRWEEACAAVFPGVPLEWVAANTWQAAMLRGFSSGNAHRTERKRASVALCRARWGTALEVDVADAALLAAWLAEQRAFNRRLTGPHGNG